MLFILFSIALFGCSSPIELGAPTKIIVEGGYINFQPVRSARGYELMVETDESTEYAIVEPGFDLNRMLEHDQSYVLRVKTLGNDLDLQDSVYSEPIDYTHRIGVLDSRRLTDEALIRWMGRVQQIDDHVAFDYTASGFQVRFYGTSLSAVLSTDVPDDAEYRPYLSVMVDGQDDPLQADVFSLDQRQGSYALVSDRELGYHDVTLYKRSEAISSKSALMGLSTDGYFVEPNTDDRPLFVVYGDSLTTGYGNVDSSAFDPYETRSQDGLLTYAALTARMFGAELEAVAVSGIGMTYGFRQYAMPEIYDRVTPKEQTTWDFSKRVPDLVIISLGANDNSVLNLQAEEERELGLMRFQADYRQFVMTLREHYPDVPIALITIDTGQNLVKPKIIELAEELDQQGVYHIPLTTISFTDGLGAGFHPTYRTHIRQADRLATALADLFGFEWKVANIEP